ncbi:hypothetical protein KAR91_46555 [Candidatus Pacearchaeota archaeon]|nr:hypothetical protein [Candidatus Pacearchaeota archaeon]
MTDFYKDTDTGNDGDNGTTWALAKATEEGLLGVMSAGDNGWGQGAAADTAASSRTFTSPGTTTNPCKITGVVDGTTNEPPVLADIAVTLPVIQTTASGAMIIGGSVQYNNIEFDSNNDFRCGTSTNQSFVNCKISYQVEFDCNAAGRVTLENTDMDPKQSTSRIRGFNANVIFRMKGGSFLAAGGVDILRTSATGNYKFIGVDMTNLTGDIQNGTLNSTVLVSNCKIPSTLGLISGGAVNNPVTSITVVGSSDDTSVGATSSIQDYQYEDLYGTIDVELTAVRTGGADDDASGAFSYAMTPKANATLESTQATLRSPWIGPMWAEAGSSTATVYVANDGGVDYNEDEMWTEFYTIDVGDTAQHDQTFDPADARLFASSTAITDDAVSTWGGSAANGQKMSSGALTYGFEGPIYARVHVAKRDATPDTVFVDPLIEVT